MLVTCRHKDSGETYIGLGRRDGFLPPLELLVDNLVALKIAEICREVVNLLAGRGVLVGDRNL